MFNKNHFIKVFMGVFVLGAMSAQAGVNIGHDIITTGSQIEVLEPGQNLQTIIDAITDEGVDKPYLIKLGPGVYTITADDVTGFGLVMAPYISIMGSGQGVTLLKGAISSASPDSSTSAIVTGANNAALTDLSVENTGGSTQSTALLNNDASPRIENVTATASGGSGVNYGVYNTTSSPTMTNVTATASGGANNYGVINLFSSPTMTHVTATGSGELFTNFGVFNSNSSPTMKDVTASGSGGSSSYGVFSFSSNNAPQIQNSTFSGDTAGFSFDGNDINTRISNTKIIGGIVNDPMGTTQCRNTYDENLADVSC